jgi:hypothetical protein
MKRNPKHIYDYRPAGKTAGKQVRFKRPARKGVDTTSMYFSRANYGSLPAALEAAKHWLVQNARWLTDRKFKPRAVKHPIAA